MNLFRSRADIGCIRHHHQGGAVLCQAANRFSHVYISSFRNGMSVYIRRATKTQRSSCGAGGESMSSPYTASTPKPVSSSSFSHVRRE